MNTASRERAYAICTRCVMDSSDTDITFDDYGVCSHCRNAETILRQVRISDEESERRLTSIVDTIRRAGVGKEYDSIVGLSGGVDSSYTAWLAHSLGLRPLAVHFDNGWNSEVAVQNIEAIIKATGFDLYTYVIDWREFRDLQRAFLRASVIDIELLTDHAILAATVKLARQHRLRYLLTGTNLATEHGIPPSWAWHKQDWTNIRAIHKAHGSIPLKTFPHLTTVHWRMLQMTRRGVIPVPLLDAVPYRRDEAAATLVRETGWREYGGKHHESVFTRFYQAEILPRKFGVDKRRAHLSDRIRNGELTRETASLELSEPAYDPDELRSESEYVRKKLGFDVDEWQAILDAPARSHRDYATDRTILDRLRLISRLGRRVERVLAMNRMPR